MPARGGQVGALSRAAGRHRPFVARTLRLTWAGCREIARPRNAAHSPLAKPISWPDLGSIGRWTHAHHGPSCRANMAAGHRKITSDAGPPKRGQRPKMVPLPCLPRAGPSE